MLFKPFSLFILNSFFFLLSYGQEETSEFKVALSNESNSRFAFTENKKQWEDHIIYKGDFSNGSLFLEKDRFTFLFFDAEHLAHMHPGDGDEQDAMIDYHAYQARFSGANNDVMIDREYAVSGYKNYFIGNDKSRWASRVKSFKMVKYKNLYHKIDLQIYGKGYDLKYDLIVHQGGSIEDVKIEYEGVDHIYLEDGNLIIHTSLNKIVEKKPYAFQMNKEERSEVPCVFVFKDNILSFHFPDGYNKTKTLYIDPTMIFSTFSGSTTDNWGSTATYDRKGNAYAGGIDFGNGYPTTLGAFQENFAGGETDIAITKYDPTGANQIYATYLGGSSSEFPHSLIVNKYDELLILGTTSSTNFPTISSSYDTTYNGGIFVSAFSLTGFDYPNGSDIIISKLSFGGDSLIASTYIGGSGNDGLNYGTRLQNNYGDQFRGEIIVDGYNNCYVATTTRSTDFPIINGFQNLMSGAIDGIVFKLDANLTTLTWSSFIGGSSVDACYSLTLNNRNDVFVAGGTMSTDFPSNGLLTSFQGGFVDGFISHIIADGTTLINSSYWGSSSYDQIYFVDIDNNKDVYVLGQTETNDSTFVKDVNFSIPYGRLFITKFAPTLDSVLLSSTYGDGDISTTPNIAPSAFLVDVCDKIYVSGWGGMRGVDFTTNLPYTDNAWDSTTDGSDFYLFVTDIDIDTLLYATFFGSSIKYEHVDGGTSRFDKLGKVYQSVCSDCFSSSDTTITTQGAWSTVNPSPSCSNLIFKFDLDFPILVADFDYDPIGCAPFTVNFVNNSSYTGTPTYFWDLGNGDSSKQASFSYIYTEPGKYEVMLAVADPFTCNNFDTIRKEVLVLADTTFAIPPDSVCAGGVIQIGIAVPPDTNISYLWNPGKWLNDSTISEPYFSPDSSVTDTSITYTLYSTYLGLCIDTIIQQVVVIPPFIHTISNDTLICEGDSAQLKATGALNYRWSPIDGLSCSLCPNPLASPGVSTTYIVDYLWYAGCNVKDTVTINVFEMPAYNLLPDSLCVGDTSQIGVITLPDSNITYLWQPGTWLSDSTISAPYISFDSTIIDSTLIYKLIATYSGICTDTITQNVVAVPPLDYSVINDTFVCDGDSITLSASGALNYIWSPDTGLSCTNCPAPKASLNKTTTYIVDLFWYNGCNERDTIIVALKYASGAAGPDTTVCIGDTVPLYSNGGIEYSWHPSTYLNDSLIANPTAIPQLPISYYAEITNSWGCIYKDTVRIDFELPGVDAGPDVYIIYGASGQLNGSVLLDSLFYWYASATLNDPTILDPTVNPLKNTKYYLKVVSPLGCTNIDSVMVHVLPNVDIPNVFSPNGDGVNEKIFVIPAGIVSLLEFKIFDRWGRLVFETNDITEGWDGTYKGKPQPIDTYVYYVKAILDESQHSVLLKGDITLIR